MARNRNRTTIAAISALAVASILSATPGDAAPPPTAGHSPAMQLAQATTPPRGNRPATAAPATPPAPTAPSTLPGGASSIHETYRDWAVICTQQGAGKRCAASQVQTQQGGQRVLAVEINAISADGASGVLVLPFGLALDNGVTLQIDDQPAMAPLRFRTCLPSGCIVVLSFDTATLTALRGGTSLKLKAVADNGNETNLAISLAGLGPALDRMATLAP